MRYCFIISLFLTLSLSLNAQLLYKVEGNGLSFPSYIFGTHHAAPLSILDSIKGYNEAFENSSVIVGEIDLSELDNYTTESIKYVMAGDGEELSNLLSAEDYALADSTFTSLTGLNLRLFNNVKPMVLSTIITKAVMSREFEGMNIDSALDLYFQTEGKKEGKKILGLETAEDQMEILFNGMTIKEQLDQLMDGLKNPEEIIASIQELNKAYLNQNLDELVEIYSRAEMSPEYKAKLVDNRNEAWVSILPEILQENSCFVAVGALHLPGENGILKKLEEKGFSISPIK